MRWVRVLWASPNSLIGLLLAGLFLLAGAQWRRVDGVLEVALKHRAAARPGVGWRLPFTAITFGHVVLGVSARELDHLRAHEHTHVRQYERWGPLFLPAYFLFGGISVRNRFERAADRYALSGRHWWPWPKP
jgi:hypothetical protein